MEQHYPCLVFLWVSHGDSSSRSAVLLCAWPFTLRRALSEPRLPSQSISRLEKFAARTAASMNHVRSMVESLSWLAPLCVMVPGVLARVRRLDMAHSSMFVAQCECGTFRGDHLGECVLKLPMISVGIVLQCPGTVKLIGWICPVHCDRSL